MEVLEKIDLLINIHFMKNNIVQFLKINAIILLVLLVSFGKAPSQSCRFIVGKVLSAENCIVDSLSSDAIVRLIDSLGQEVLGVLDTVNGMGFYVLNVESISNGRYGLSITKVGFETIITNPHNLDSLINGDFVRFTMSCLPTIKSIKGTLVNHPNCNTNPLPQGVSITMIDTNGASVNGITSVITDSLGNFTFDNVELSSVDTTMMASFIVANGLSLQNTPFKTIGQWINESPINLVLDEVFEEWVQRYNGTDSSGDFVTTIDVMGNVYITGSARNIGTGNDITTIKYKPDGTQDWVVSYNGLSSLDDAGIDIKVDDDCNVYVLGTSKEVGAQNEMTLIKYDSSGNVIWINHLDTLSSGRGAVAIDISNQGDIYVTGTIGAFNAANIITYKINSSGNRIWLAIFNNINNNGDEPSAIAIDSAENIYITGRSNNNGITIKYDKNGILQWQNTFNGTATNSFDLGHSVAVGKQGVYVLGTIVNASSISDIITIKYSSNGVEEWTSVFNGVLNSEDIGRAMKVDDLDNVYVTGTTITTNIVDFITIKYNSLGAMQWANTYNGTGNFLDEAVDIALDNENDVYVTGFSQEDNGFDITTIKYNADGNTQWIRHFDGPLAGNDFDQSIAITTDNFLNVYVIGQTRDIGTSIDFTTIKYAQCKLVIPPSGLAPAQSQVQNIVVEDTTITTSVFPNPSDGSVTVVIENFDATATYEVFVFDMYGQQKQRIQNIKTNQVNLDLKILGTGIYFYQVHSSKSKVAVGKNKIMIR